MQKVSYKTLKIPRSNAADLERGVATALVVLQGTSADMGVHWLVDAPTTIGRGPGVDMALLDETLSRRHCAVLPFDGKVVIDDLGSTNGTFLNGQRVTRATELVDGNLIFIGDTVLKFSAGFDLGYHARMDARVGLDDLTGLAARHRFEGAFLRALETAAAEGAPLGVLMLDLDGVKLINDTHGHLFGAFTIAEAGRIIGTLLPPAAVATRLGGDEFAAFLPSHTREQTLALGETIIRSMDDHHFEKDGIAVRASISIGVASFPEDGDGPDELLRRADEALYRAKRGGKNRVAV